MATPPRGTPGGFGPLIVPRSSAGSPDRGSYLPILCYRIIFADWDDLLSCIVHDSGYG